MAVFMPIMTESMMKKKLSYLVSLAVASVLLLVSCQEEQDRTITGDDQLSKSAPLTQRLQGITANNTAIDNVIDSTDCFSVKLPVQVLVSGQVVTVSSESDYATVEELLQQPVGATVDFVFPITVIDASYEQTTVTSEDQFEALLQDCEAPEAAGCFTISYPITVLAYDPATQVPSTQTLDNDQEFYLFLFSLPESSVYEIQYPISVDSGQGIPSVITSNEALTAAIGAAIEACACDNPQILTDDLIIYMPFANEIADLTGFSSPTLTGGAVFVQDRSGNPNGALSFTAGGTQNFVTVPGNANNDLMQANAFSISLWFNRQDPQNFGVEQLYSTEGFLLGLGDPFNTSEIRNPFMAAPNFEYSPDFSWQEQGLLGELNVWHHIVVTWDGFLLRLYRDGVLGANAESPGFPNQMLGAILGGNYRGHIDDLRVYKRTLTEQEVITLLELEGDVNTCLE